MKKLFIFICVLFCALTSHSQNNPNYNYQKLPGSTPKTIVFGSNLQLDSALIFIYSYSDTISANIGHIDEIAGAQIKVGDSIYMRANCKCQWLLQTNSTSPVLSTQNLLLMTGGYTLVDSTLTILAKIVWLFNGVRYNQPSNQVFTINTLPSGYKRSDVIWIDSFQVFRKTVGVADTTTAVLPQIPYNGITVAIADINGSSITANVVSSFQKKAFVYTNPVTGQLTTDSVNAGYDATTRNSNFGGNITIPVGKTFNIGDASNSFGYDGTNFVNLKSYVGNFRLYNSYGNNVLMQLYYNNGSTNKGFINLNSFGFGTTSPDTSAVLDVASTTRGMLIPRVTTAQRNAISGATKSLLIYNNTIDSFQYYNAGWHTIGAGGGSSGQDTLFVVTPLKVNSTNDTLYMNQVSDVDSGWVSPDQKAYWDAGGNSWGLEGSAGTDPTINFLGTTDAQPLYLRVNNDTVAKFGLIGNIVIGNLGTTSTGTGSVALGLGNHATGDASFATGNGSNASGSTSLSANSGTNATGDASSAFGSSTSSQGTASTSTGYSTVAAGDKSFSMGNGTIAVSKNSLVIGRSNDTTGQSVNDTSVLFRIGNGYVANDETVYSQSNILTTTYTGLLIGNHTSENNLATLHVKASDTFALMVTGMGNSVVGTDSAVVRDINGNFKVAAKSSTDTTSLSNRINLKANIASPTFTGLITADTIKPLRIRFASTGGIQGASSINFDGNSTATTNGISYGQFNLYRDASNSFTIGSLTTKVGNLIMTNGSQLYWANRAVFNSSADGKINLTNNSVNNFTSLGFGLETSAFPAIFRSGTIAQFRLGDNSDDAPISVSTVKVKGYTVATLPAAGTAGRMAYVTDALAPTFLGVLTGGGTVVTPVFDNGTAWVAH